MKIGIIGLGYVGLPLAVAFAEAGHDVVGLDADPHKIGSLERGESYIEDIPSAALAPLGERLHTDHRHADLASCDAVIICVPTPLTGSREPDLTYLLDAGQALSPASSRRASSSCSSRPPTRARPASAWRRSSRSPASPPARDFHLAFSPERIDPGRTDYTVRTTPKLVGGMTAACTERARELYALICDEVVVLSSPEAAELSKLLENIFRSVNIAFVNELAQLCDRLEIDVWEVIDAASTKPFGFMRFEPGPGMGGHCLPVDPFYLAFKAREHDFYPEFIELAGKMNQAQPAFCAERIERALNDVGKPVNGSKILILGVSYKAGGRRHPRVAGAEDQPPCCAIWAATSPTTTPTSRSCPSSTSARSTSTPPCAAADVAAIVTAHPSSTTRPSPRRRRSWSTSAVSRAASRPRT